MSNFSYFSLMRHSAVFVIAALSPHSLSVLFDLPEPASEQANSVSGNVADHLRESSPVDVTAASLQWR